jgi:hypothetical protein
MIFETGSSGILSSPFPEQSTSFSPAVHVHVDGHEFDPSVRQIEKMKINTVALVSIVSFV